VLFNYNLSNLNNEIKSVALQSFTTLKKKCLKNILLFHPAVERKESERERKITLGKMQMSLEAITMLMRFHHRSCCSGIRGVFPPYLEKEEEEKTIVCLK